MKPEHIYKRQRDRARRAVGLCRCGDAPVPGRTRCARCSRVGYRVELRAAAHEAVRKLALRSGQSMRAALDELVMTRLKRMGVG